MTGSRRSFLGWMAALGAQLALLGWPGPLARDGERRGRAPRPWPSPARELIERLPSPAAARRVGREYLRGAPEEADPQRLLELILEGGTDRRLELWRRRGRRGDDLLRSWVAEDFERGRIASVRGWILSSTEARLCALAALCAPGVGSDGLV